MFVATFSSLTKEVEAQVIREANPQYSVKTETTTKKKKNFAFRRTLMIGAFQAFNGEIPIIYSVSPRPRFWLQLGAGATYRYPFAADLAFGGFSGEDPTSFGVGPHGQLGVKYYIVQYNNSGIYLGLNARFSNHPSVTQGTYNTLNSSNELESVTEDFKTWTNYYYGNLMLGYTVVSGNGRSIVETYVGLGVKYREFESWDDYTYSDYYQDPVTYEYTYYTNNPQTTYRDYIVPSIKFGLNFGLTWP